MSIDLDWSALDAQLTLSTTEFLSTAFSSAPRPNFLGPLTLTNFSFGGSHPDIELVDIGDIFREFLQHQDDDSSHFAPPPPAPPPHPEPAAPSSDYDSFRGTQRPFPFSPPAGIPSGAGASLFSPGLLHHSFPSPSLGAPRSRSGSRSHSPAPPLFPLNTHSHPHPLHLETHSSTHPHSAAPPSPSLSHSSLPPPTSSSAPSPSLQAHLHLRYSGNLSLGLSTSLLINYPSLGFMSLPLTLTLTSLAFEGTLVVAYEGGRRRVHLSLLDPGAEGGVAGGGGKGKETPGMRLLRSAVVESEVGQADKHVLKNVGKVEKFVLEVARKTLENELVFPNFHTIAF
ncbi:hypothetical protein JCM8547_004825 [Rhodosporidiobolus lusitaniae]